MDIQISSYTLIPGVEIVDRKGAFTYEPASNMFMHHHIASTSGWVDFEPVAFTSLHVHTDVEGVELLPERIRMFGAPMLCQTNNVISVIRPGDQITIGKGVRHGWAICAAGTMMPWGEETTDHASLMIFDYPKAVDGFRLVPPGSTIESIHALSLIPKEKHTIARLTPVEIASLPYFENGKLITPDPKIAESVRSRPATQPWVGLG